MKKGESVGVSMILKTGMEVYQYYTVFNYRPPRPHKYLKSQDRTIMAGPGVKLAPIFFSQGTLKIKLESTPPKSLAQPVGALKDLMKNICNLKGALVFCTYHWPNGLK